jgi:hypothetical protein
MKDQRESLETKKGLLCLHLCRNPSGRSKTTIFLRIIRHRPDSEQPNVAIEWLGVPLRIRDVPG